MVGAFAPQQRKDNSYYHTLVDFERDGHYFDIYKCMCEYCFMQVSVEFLIRYLIHILKSLQISDEERVKSKCESSAIHKRKNRRPIKYTNLVITYFQGFPQRTMGTISGTGDYFNQLIRSDKAAAGTNMI